MRRSRSNPRQRDDNNARDIEQEVGSRGEYGASSSSNTRPRRDVSFQQQGWQYAMPNYPIAFASSSHSSAAGGPLDSIGGWVVFVTGINDETQKDDIHDTFSEVGHINNISMNFDVSTGHNKGYALVEYPTRNEAQDAINRLHGSRLLGKTIGVHWAFVQPGTS